MVTTTALMTAEDLEAMEPEGSRLELFAGVPREQPGMSIGHGAIGGEFIYYLAVYTHEHRLGQIYNSDTRYVIARDPDDVVMPDVSFVRADRIPPVEEWDRMFRIAPDLVVEIVSPTNRFDEVMDKVDRYRRAGVPIIWLVQPRRRTVTAFTDDGERTLIETDFLDGGDVLPGFRLQVAKIFAHL